MGAEQAVQAGGSQAEDTQEVDRLGEVINIVSGNAIQHLSRNGIELAITTPSLVVGESLEIHLLNQNTYSITMLSALGEIDIDIAIKRI